MRILWKNPGESVILYLTGPADIFTAFFSDFMFLRAVMTRHENPQTFPGFQKKTKNPPLSRFNLGWSLKKIVVVACPWTKFLVVGFQQQKNRVRR